VNLVQEVDQPARILLRQAKEGFVLRLGRDVPDTVEHRARLVGQKEAARPAVGGVRAAFDPARFLHAVDLAYQRHRPDLEEVGETRLVDPLVSREIAKRAALRARQPKPAAVDVEAAAEEARDVIDQKPETSFQIEHLYPARLPPRLIIRV
jgi:hypothetical protein